MKTDIRRIKTEQGWTRLYNRLDENHLLNDAQKDRSFRLSSWIRYGAVAAVLMGMVWGMVFWKLHVKEEVAELTVQENQGPSTLATTLEDGSVVLLAKEASLQYPEHFVIDKREVNLQGIAFFDIAKIQNSPFLIHTEQAKIEVLGTAFSVQSSPDSSFRLSVQRGLVKVSLKKGDQECYVKAGETAVLQSQHLVVKETDKGDVIWNSYFEHVRFKDESLANVLKIMNMKPDSRQIRLASSTLGDRKLTVEFADESSEVIADLIASALHLKCSRQGDTFVLAE